MPDHIAGSDHPSDGQPTSPTQSDAGDRPADTTPAEPVVPQRIGNFTIMRVLGQGGMGTVYEARQESPRRPVALKIIRAGFLSPQMLRRFGQESQVLGRLQHPGIAQVYEAGVFNDDHGNSLPFFAMEFIKGVPLNSYADSRSLGSRARMELLARVCDAVYHAHQKGVIHRDLKPGNILVDESGQPKILDFGVARATDSDLQQTTLQTDIGQIIGTLPYMSPEQISGDPGELDTRSDVYALGVIAYELLAGRLPHNLQKKMIHEAARIIREEEPAKLSSINRTLKGDVETIVVKALEKNKARRYQSAESFASDIRRYLADEPIAARPASAWYQLAKFSRRNKALVGGVVVAFLLLAAGLVGTSYGLRQALLARDGEADAKQEALRETQRAKEAELQTKARADELQLVADFQSGMIDKLNPIAAGNELTADVLTNFARGLSIARPPIPEDQHPALIEAFKKHWQYVNATDASREFIDRTLLKPALATIAEKFKDQPIVAAQLRQALVTQYTNLGLYESAMAIQVGVLADRRRLLGEDHLNTINSIEHMGQLAQARGKLADAELHFRDAYERRQRTQGDDDRQTLTALNNLGDLYRNSGKLDLAEPLLSRSLASFRRVYGNDDYHTITSMNTLGQVYMRQGKPELAEPLWREAYQTGRRVYGDDDRRLLVWANNYAAVLLALNKLDEAEPLRRETLQRARRLLGNDHPDTAIFVNNMGLLLQRRGKFDEAEVFFREGLESRRKLMGDDDPSTLKSIEFLGALYREQGKLDQAEAQFRLALAGRRRIAPQGDARVQENLADLAGVLDALNRPAESEPLLRELLDARVASLPPGNYRIAAAQSALGASLAAQEKFAAAEPLLVQGYQGLLAAPDTPRSTRDQLRIGCERALDLYARWEKADPGKGHETKAAEWKAKLDALPPPAPPAPPPK